MIQSYVNQALKTDSRPPSLSKQPKEVEIPNEIKNLSDSALGKELHRLRKRHLKQNGDRKVLSYRHGGEFTYLQALEADWKARIPKLVEFQES